MWQAEPRWAYDHGERGFELLLVLLGCAWRCSMLDLGFRV